MKIIKFDAQTFKQIAPLTFQNYLKTTPEGVDLNIFKKIYNALDQTNIYLSLFF